MGEPLPEYALTLPQPHADLIVAGVQDVLSLPFPPPSTLPCMRPGRPHDHTADAHPLCTPFPFAVGIHAASELDTEAVHAWEALAGQHGGISWLSGMATLIATVKTDALLGTVIVVSSHHADDCRDERAGWGEDPLTVWHCSPSAEPGCWHWQIADPEPLPEPIPARGRQSLWRIPDDVRVGRG